MTSVRLPAELDTQLNHLCALTKRPRSFFIREALERYLEEMEDACVALERIAQPKRRFYTSGEVLKKLNDKK